MSYAFTFDSSTCSGCKACQEACKDKNKLPTGLLWRRVIEVSGGEWHTTGSGWENSIFAYNLSLACNHCTHPKCAGVCPTDAYIVRRDGIVIIDESRCMGCGYCAWACPYGAPQYDIERGIMTKCDFCHDYIDAGMPPSCVASCPLRVLDFNVAEALNSQDRGNILWQLPATGHPFPLPNYSRTEPHLVIKPHPGMNNQLTKAVSNLEEILPPGSSDHNQGLAGMHELPLVAFTLLTQMAAGMAVGNALIRNPPLVMLLSIGVLLLSGGLFSFLHLGRKRNAWRAVIHLKKSWLSREILMAGLFGITWVATIGLQVFGKLTLTSWLMAILGLVLVYCMAQVYRLRAVPTWNSWRTPARFFLTTAVLGTLGVNIFAPSRGWLIAAGIAMVAELSLLLTERRLVHNLVHQLQLIFLGMGIAGALVLITITQANHLWPAIIIFLVATTAEAIGRWHFYIQRVPFPMPTDRTEVL